jgi:PBSX family phage terminase large subunit
MPMTANDIILSKLTTKQKAVYLDERANRPVYSVLHGAVRSGKTFLGANILWMLHVAQFAGRGVNFIMTGYTLSSLKKNVLDDLEENFGIDTHLDSNNSFEMMGNRILCFGTNAADSYKAMRGLTAYGWYANEITLSHKNSVDEAIKRCSGTGARFFWETNPDNPNHYIKKDYIDRSGMTLESGRVLIKEYHFELEDNDRLPAEYVESLKKTTPAGIMYDRAIKGLWTAREGLIYDCYIPSQMTKYYHDINIKETFAGVDWGFEHKGVIVIIGVDYDGTAHIVDIVAEAKKDIDWWCAKQAELKQKWKCNEWWCDSARPEYVLKFGGKEADKAVIEGIETVYSMFSNSRLFVADKVSCILESELYNYVWKDSGVKEEPVKENDDIMDALRYAIFNRYGKKRTRNPYLEMARNRR